MTKFLIRKFINNPDAIGEPKVREAYGRLAGAVGIITNALLCLLKGALGFATGSIAIIADAFNNLSDAAASLITLIGFKLAAKKGDKQHPYGHARMEYMTGVLIAALIILLGFQLLVESFKKALNPAPVSFGIPMAALLAVAILVKVWQAAFNFTLAKRSKSTALRATGMDSRNDVIVTSAVLLAYVIQHITGVAVDGYMGILVAAFIIYSGVMLIKETMDPLLGAAPDPDLVKKIGGIITSRDGVLGIHDLIVHDYGPGRMFASVHIEVPAANDIIASHEIIDDLEKEIYRDLGIEIVGHLDPVDLNDPLAAELREKVSALVAEIDGCVSMHDLRIVRGENRINIIFDVVLSAECRASHDATTAQLAESLKREDSRYELVITYDTDYT
jgi:cation diffusion facilitator family transporter